MTMIYELEQEFEAISAKITEAFESDPEEAIKMADRQLEIARELMRRLNNET